MSVWLHAHTLLPDRVVPLVDVSPVGDFDADKVQNNFDDHLEENEALENIFLVFLALGKYLIGEKLHVKNRHHDEYNKLKLDSEPEETSG